MASLLPELIALDLLPNVMSPSTFGITEKYVTMFKRFSESRSKHYVKERFKLHFINVLLFNLIFALLLFISCLKLNLIFWKKWR